MARLLIASNRLPITVSLEEGGFSFSSSSGGLATGLSKVCPQSDALWIGWPGDLPRLGARRRHQLDELLLGHQLQAVYLSRAEARGYYEEVANGALWPVFHSQTGQVDPVLSGWDEFVAVNERFASTIAERYQPGDLIWVHDYHLALVPKMLRSLLPGASIGFFLHIPFPAPEAFSILPWRGQLLEGLLGADLIGFHTDEWRQNFFAALQRLLGLQPHGDTIQLIDRQLAVGVFPMGIDAQAWQQRSEDPNVQREVEDLGREAGGRQLLLGIDRLDYTKGILRRALSVERLLAMDENLAEQLRYIQVTVPTRQHVAAYTQLARDVDETLGRINGQYTSASAVPIHRIHRNLSEHELSVLYRAADVMLVTPLRDGMNLVAKEFIASRSDEDGVLVLSEFTGAASELREALLVNPYDLDGTASVILRALTMPREERQRRMRALRQRVFEQDVHRWVRTFLEALTEHVAGRHQPITSSLPARVPDLTLRPRQYAVGSLP